MQAFGKGYRRYVLGVLTLVYTLNYLDRGLIILLLQPIKEDLHLSDTQLGFVTGIAFGVFYATIGLPLARWADRGNRVTLSSLAIGLWGITVMASLAVTNFVQLVCARIAAAVGEAGCLPPTYSLIGDYFPAPAERTSAMSIYWLASPVAVLVSLVAGGWLNEHYGWRMTFFIMGLPAFAVAALVKLTVRETRTKSEHLDHHGASTLGAVASLWRQRSSRQLSIAIILFFVMTQGLSPWLAVFMIRSHGMNTQELGLSLGLIFGLGGIAGNLLGGFITSRWLRDEKIQMIAVAWLMALLLPCLLVALLLPSTLGALAAFVPWIMILNFSFGPVFALLQRLVPDSSRATTLAAVMFLANLIGMGAGPQVVGILSDLLAPLFAVDSLRYAMLFASLVSVWAAYHFWQVARSVRTDLAATSNPSSRAAGDGLTLAAN